MVPTNDHPWWQVHDGDDELQRRNCIILKPIFPGDHEYRLALESAFQKRTWTGMCSRVVPISCLRLLSSIVGIVGHSPLPTGGLASGKLNAGSHKGRVKCLVVGPAGVGKTALVNSFFENRSNEVRP